eukprot:m.212872 g.212872  ORF g.212872 m.212872 type:complete len:180 (+) comp26163_c0_seq12:1300-1839(+)
MTNFELGTHIPMFISAPWKPNSVGKKTMALMEAVDLYSTIAALAGLESPHATGQALNSTDMSPLFDDPTQSIKDAAFSQFGKKGVFDVHPEFYRNQTMFMGYTIRTDDWRYTAWFNFDDKTIKVKTNSIVGRELYTHKGDEGMYLDFQGEHINLVEEEQYQDIVQSLHARILDYIQIGE